MSVAGAAGAAEVKYSADDVLGFFLGEGALGQERGICVGTAEECGQAAKPAGFDVMVNFDLNSAELRPDAVSNLEQVALALADPRLQGLQFSVEGYTDASGGAEYNQLLSQRRAASVASFLAFRGVPQDLLIPVGLGEMSPRVDDPMDPVNRRVEMRITAQ